MTDLVGIREAARAVGLSPSTISRYVANNPELNRGTPEQPAVVLGELRAHRAQNVNQLKSRNHAGELFDADPVGGGEAIEETAPAGDRSQQVSVAAGETGQAPKGAYSKAKAARETLLARRAQIELDQMLGRLVARAEVEEGAAELAGMLQTSLLQLTVDLAEPLSTMTEPAEISTYLDGQFRQLLERLRLQLETIAREMSDAAA